MLMSTPHSTVSAGPRMRAQLQPSFKYPPAGQGTCASRPSARSTYPRFVSVQDTALVQLKCAWRGLFDAFKWNIVFSTVASDAEIRANVYKSVVLNSLSLFSIYVFDLLLYPLVHNQPKWFHRNIGWFYQVLWLLPVVGTSLYLNGTWCTIIAKRTYLLQHGGRPVSSSAASSWQQAQTYTGLLRSIATSAYRFVMVCTSVVVAFALGKIPFVGGWVAEFVFMCWVDAYYCFEFVWISRGYSLSKRIRHLEERWAYYFAFGLPSTALCMWGSTLANVALFALIFPAYIIMAMHARPIPNDPYNPLPTIISNEDDSQIIQHPSPFIPIRIPIFAIVIYINDAIVKMLNAIGGRPMKHGHERSISSDYTQGRSRADSAGQDSVEEGNGKNRHVSSRLLGKKRR